MPFVKWDFAAWKADTRRWTFRRRGVYFQLLQEIYISEGRFCLDDLRWFRKEVGLRPQSVNRIIEWLLEQGKIWTDQNGVFHQKRADEELAKRIKSGSRLHDQGQKRPKDGSSLQPRLNENKDLTPPKIDREIEGKNIPTKTRPKASPKEAHSWHLDQVPDDWRPAMRERFPHLNIATEAEKFVIYWTERDGKGAAKKDWKAAWRNWCIKAEEFRQERNPENPIGPTYTGAAI